MKTLYRSMAQEPRRDLTTLASCLTQASDAGALVDCIPERCQHDRPNGAYRIEPACGMLLGFVGISDSCEVCSCAVWVREFDRCLVVDDGAGLDVGLLIEQCASCNECGP